MLTSRQTRRALHVLGALNKANTLAMIEPTASRTSVLLRLSEGQTFKLDHDLVRHMVSAGWLKAIDHDGAMVLQLTEDGRSFRHRQGQGGDHGGQHREIGRGKTVDGEDAAVNYAESPLTRLSRVRGTGRQAWIDAGQLAAGERLRADFEHGLMRPRVTASWDLAQTASTKHAVPSGRQNLSERALDARSRVNAALAAVGPELSGILLDVCCFLKGLEQVEAERKWPRRSAKVILRAALDALDRHYNPSHPRSGRLRRWGSVDYRPEL